MPLKSPSESRNLGLLLVGHGTRDPRGIAEFQQLEGRLREQLPEVRIAAAFLELADPSLAEGLSQLVEQGVRQIVVSPLLLFSAGHAKEDIPRAIQAARSTLPPLTIHFADPLGCHERMVAASVARFHQALEHPPPLAADETYLILVGRGSSDAEATAAFQEFGIQHRLRSGAARLETCFLAVARPTLAEAIVAASASSCPHVVLQPHLLFQGELVENLRSAVAAAQTATPGKTWRLAGHLGPTRAVAEAARDRFWDALAETPPRLGS